MEQLERINKEIKSVKTEVEEKQKMLPRFTLALEELSQSPMVSLSDTNVKQAFPENSLLPQEKCLLFHHLLFVYFWLCRVFFATHRLSLVAVNGLLSTCGAGASRGRIADHGLWGTRASIAGARWLSCSVACGIFLDQGSSPCPLD